MKDTWGKADGLLEQLLDLSAPGALLKDHLLEDLILPKGVGGNQVGSARERQSRVCHTPITGFGSFCQL